VSFWCLLFGTWENCWFLKFFFYLLADMSSSMCNGKTLTIAKRAKRDALLKPIEIVQTEKKVKRVLPEDFSQLLIKSVS
jgi:hypothetical protein